MQLQGEVALYSGDNATAETSFQRAIELDPNDLGAYEKLARYLMVTGRQDEVVKTYEAALAQNPDSARLHLTVGSLYELRQDVPKAIQHYEDAVRLDPKLAVAKNNLAYLIAETGGNLDRALDLAQEAKELLPDNPNAADTLGWVLYKKQSHDAAIGYLREAVRGMEPDDPQLPIVRQHLALAYEAAGDVKSAREVVDEAIADIEARRGREGGEAGAEPPWAGDIRALRARLGADRLLGVQDLRPAGRCNLLPASARRGRRLARPAGRDGSGRDAMRSSMLGLGVAFALGLSVPVAAEDAAPQATSPSGASAGAAPSAAPAEAPRPEAEAAEGGAAERRTARRRGSRPRRRSRRPRRRPERASSSVRSSPTRRAARAASTR